MVYGRSGRGISMINDIQIVCLEFPSLMAYSIIGGILVEMTVVFLRQVAYCRYGRGIAIVDILC